MELNATELNIMAQIAVDNRTIEGIARETKKSRAQTYRTAKILKEKGLAVDKRGALCITREAHPMLLAHLAADHPEMIELLSGSGIEILKHTLEAKTATQIQKQTKLCQAIIHRKLKTAIQLDAVRKEPGNNYIIHERRRPKLKEFLEKLREHERMIDDRIPQDAIIFRRSGATVIFSSNENLTNAARTAFSAFERFGIRGREVGGKVKYWRIPKTELTIYQVFRDSLTVAEQTKSKEQLTLIGRFWVKHKKRLGKVRHPIIYDLHLVMDGAEVEGYPRGELKSGPTLNKPKIDRRHADSRE